MRKYSVLAVVAITFLQSLIAVSAAEALSVPAGIEVISFAQGVPYKEWVAAASSDGRQVYRGVQKEDRDLIIKSDVLDGTSEVFIAGHKATGSMLMKVGKKYKTFAITDVQATSDNKTLLYNEQVMVNKVTKQVVNSPGVGGTGEAVQVGQIITHWYSVDIATKKITDLNKKFGFAHLGQVRFSGSLNKAIFTGCTIKKYLTLGGQADGLDCKTFVATQGGKGRRLLTGVLNAGGVSSNGKLVAVEQNGLPAVLNFSNLKITKIKFNKGPLSGEPQYVQPLNNGKSILTSHALASGGAIWATSDYKLSAPIAIAKGFIGIANFVSSDEKVFVATRDKSFLEDPQTFVDLGKPFVVGECARFSGTLPSSASKCVQGLEMPNVEVEKVVSCVANAQIPGEFTAVLDLKLVGGSFTSYSWGTESQTNRVSANVDYRGEAMLTLDLEFGPMNQDIGVVYSLFVNEPSVALPEGSCK